MRGVILAVCALTFLPAAASLQTPSSTRATTPYRQQPILRTSGIARNSMSSGTRANDAVVQTAAVPNYKAKTGRNNGRVGQGSNRKEGGQQQAARVKEVESPPVPTFREFLRFATPCLGLWISGPLLSLTDTFFIGRNAVAGDSARDLAALGGATTLYVKKELDTQDDHIHSWPFSPVFFC